MRLGRETTRSVRRRARPGVRFVRRLSGDRISEEGAALVEAVLILPVLIVMCFGLVEFGLIYKDTLKNASAARAGARAGASAIKTDGSDGQTSDADFQILQAVQAGLGPLADAVSHADTRIVIYKANGADGTPASSGCDVTGNGTVNVCNIYTAADFNPPLVAGSFAPDNNPADCTGAFNFHACQQSQYWPAGSRKILFNDPPDWIGVWLTTRHDYTTGIFGQSRSLSDQTVIRLEPPGVNPSLYSTTPTSFATTSTTLYTGVAGVVWNDANKDGIYVKNVEPVVPSVAWKLTDTGTGGTTTGLTAADGTYKAITLAGHTYTMTFTAPTGNTFTTYGAGTVSPINSNVNQATGLSLIWTAANGITQPVYAGLVVPNTGCLNCGTGTVSGLVWNDANDNGVRETPDVSGTEVYLVSRPVGLYLLGATSALTTTSTNASGAFSFPNLGPGNYYIKVTGPGGGAQFSPQGTGDPPTPALDSDVNSSGQSGTIVVTSATVADNDAGIYVPGCLQNCPPGGGTTTSMVITSISGVVWNDTNYDGIRQDSEAKVLGHTVRLINPINGATITSTTTDSVGHYVFSGLVAGANYQVQFVLNAGEAATKIHASGGDTTSDSDIDIAGKTTSITAVSGSDISGNDAGIIYPTISGVVWKDTNGDGIRQTTETTRLSVTVTLLTQAGATVATMSSNGSTGFYFFGSVVPGSYYVQFSLASGYSYSPLNQGTDPTIDSNAIPTTGKTTLITTSTGSSFTNIDAGEIAPAAATTTTIPPS